MNKSIKFLGDLPRKVLSKDKVEIGGQHFERHDIFIKLCWFLKEPMFQQILYGPRIEPPEEVSNG